MAEWLDVGEKYVVVVITKRTKQRDVQITLPRTFNTSTKGNRSDVKCIYKINLYHVLELCRL